MTIKNNLLPLYEYQDYESFPLHSSSLFTLSFMDGTENTQNIIDYLSINNIKIVRMSLNENLYGGFFGKKYNDFILYNPTYLNIDYFKYIYPTKCVHIKTFKDEQSLLKYIQNYQNIS